MSMTAKPPWKTAGGDPGDTLSRIEARLERIEERLSRLDAVTEQLPGVAATAGDIFDEWATNDGRADQRLRALAALVEKLTRPEVLATLDQAVTMAEAVPGVVATGVDTFDELVREASAQGIDVDRSLVGLVRLLGHADRALAHARQAQPRRLGAFGLLRALREPGVQRAMGFLLDLAGGLGEAMIREDEGAPALPSG
ncbi:MAG: DUF1641 domain-containing protein [Myxococcales bacterium]|nr:DUF1641 domain-containing protein [Myxococcales bacterium]